MSAPDAELPKLSKEQADIAKRMEIPEKEYARGVLVGAYAQERNKARGEQLGRRIDEVLCGLGSAYYTLSAIIREATEFRWIARILTPKGVKNAAIPLDLADDVIDSSSPEVFEKLRRLVLGAVGREDLLAGQPK